MAGVPARPLPQLCHRRGGGTLPGVGTSSDTSDLKPSWIRVVDRASVAAFVVVWAAVGCQLLATHPPTRLVLLGIAALIPAVLLADLVSGLVHWFADRYLDPATPVLGPMLIEPFREHHRDPHAMARHDFFEVSGNNGLVTLPLAVGLLVLDTSPGDPVWSQLARVATVLFALAVFVTNQLHAWAHAQAPPGWVRRLQRARVILSPQAHTVHHAHGYDRAYCVTTGWLNPLLDRVGAFAVLEALLARAGLELATQARREGRTR